MSALRIESTRGELVESVHRVSVAVTDTAGALVAEAGSPRLVTFWRSAAKPFQALPLLQDGAVEAFGLGDEELALACASHSSEAVHLAVTDRFLARIGASESDLACGPHTPLGAAVAAEVARSGIRLTPRWSNCSGKHAGMLALARHHGWATAGYERIGHPVQDRVVAEVERWTDVSRDEMGFGVDGCTAACFAVPLTAMATAYARFGTSQDPHAARLRRAMVTHPMLVAGTGRFCTDLMAAWPGGVIAKIGAEGVYSAALPHLGLGVAVKIEDGDMRSAPGALLAVIRSIVQRRGGEGAEQLESLARAIDAPIHNSRDEVTGTLRASGALRFSA